MDEAGFVERSCASKRRYSRKDKRRALAQTRHVGGSGLQFYRCTYCSVPGRPAWHIGHRIRRKRRNDAPGTVDRRAEAR